ncbi:unnamed protein product [Urochloa humidicola]
MKYVVVTGGVVSGLGNGVAASSIGVVLKACGLRVTFIKIDPYLNMDAGTMSPDEHGEVFVLDDGSEVDMDLGNYERFLDAELTGDNHMTTGKIYQYVVDKERRGDYLGKTVQIVPHITNAIQEWIERIAMIPVDGRDGTPDVCIVELGGTIGDIELMPFIEALSQFSYRTEDNNFCLVHVSLVPVIDIVGEQKTKPTQFSVQSLRELGLTPNLLACRSTAPLNKNVKEKLSQFCHVPVDCIVGLSNVPNIWHVPSLLIGQKAHEAILGVLGLPCLTVEPKLDAWMDIARTCDELHAPVRIAVLVGKDINVSNAYRSILEAMLHASVACQRRLVVDWVPASDLDEETANQSPDLHEKAWSLLKGADGVLVPGGFGDGGVEGKILAAKYSRENNVPYLGIELGMQVAIIEFARHVLGLKDANSAEFDAGTRYPCLIQTPEMCIGSRRTFFRTMDCKSAKLYGNVRYVDERRRHRYEVNPDMVGELESAGAKFVGTDEAGDRMQILELPWHRFFVGAQFHPEFKSRPGKPSPLFTGLIEAASSGQRNGGSMPQQSPSNLEKRPIPVKVASGSTTSGGLEDGLVGLHVSGAALAHYHLAWHCLESCSAYDAAARISIGDRSR